jgi:glycosyltransferase involved in cell wall biosynthesis
MIRVGYIAGEPTPWRAPHLDRIAGHPEIDLTVIYAAPTVQRREWELDLNHNSVILRGPSLPLTRVLHHDYPLTPQIWSVLDHERFDVLVIGGWSLLATQLAILWARLHDVPYLMISENHLLERRRAWVRGVKSVVLRAVIPPADGHLVTGTLAREHARRYGARPELVTVFPNTVDVKGYRLAAERLRERRGEIRRALWIPDDALVVTTVGRLIRAKGVDELLEAVALARSLTSRTLHLLLVGTGELRRELTRGAGVRELPVTFAGFRQGEALLECFAAADVFALFSRREPWGVVVNEAAAFGLPLVLTEEVGASADLLRPGENGELVRSGDVDGQARAIARLADDDELRARFGGRSVELVEPWGYEPSVEPFVEAVRRALRARQPLPPEPSNPRRYARRPHR